MRKLDDTLTNENREDIEDPNHALFRADKLFIVSIFNMNDSEKVIESIEDFNKYISDSFYYSKEKQDIEKSENFSIGKIKISDYYDQDIESTVFSHGIHYYKTLETVFYNRTDLNDIMYTGKFMSWYPNGSIKIEGNYDAGYKVGNWIEYYENGNIKSEKEYSFDVLDGKYIEYANGNYECKNCDNSSHIQVSGRYIKNRKNGIWIENYSNGFVKSRGEYIDYCKNGQWTYWDPTGKKRAEVNYENDKVKGNFVLYYENGQKKLKGEFINEHLTGSCYVWHDNGMKKIEMYILNDNLHGKYIYWYSNGVKCQESDFDNGKLKSPSVFWKKDGTLDTYMNYYEEMKFKIKNFSFKNQINEQKSEVQQDFEKYVKRVFFWHMKE
jgi:antitoxin component YwqK of YwqJK toxin-antitoxin module